MHFLAIFGPLTVSEAILNNEWGAHTELDGDGWGTLDQRYAAKFRYRRRARFGATSPIIVGFDGDRLEEF